jgi:RimJ/RimL family protein N-acetyltransferase
MTAAAQPELETLRLRLRPRTIDDLEASLAMDLDPEVHRYIFAEPPDPDARRTQILAHIASGGPPVGGIWVVEWRETPGFLGWCGLFPLEHSGLVEIGYRYVRAAWGQGVATDAARAVLDHGFRQLALDRIVAVAHPDNSGSHRVLEKIGLRRAGEAWHYGQWLLFYQLTRAEYIAAA